MLEEIKKIKQKSPNFEVFKKHFFNWFNAFQVMKYVHFCRDNFYPNQDLIEACNLLLNEKYPTELDYLIKFRTLDLKNDY